MIFGSAAWGFRELPLEKRLEITKKLGLLVHELGIENADTDVKFGDSIAEIKDLYKKYDIELVCAATGNDFTNGNKDDVEKVKKVIDMCAELGVKYLRVFAGFSPVAEVVGNRWDVMIECLTEVGNYSKEKGVTLAVETHGGVNGFDDGVEHFYSTSTEPKALKKILDQIPENVFFNYDPANLYAVGIENPDEIYQLIKERVAYAHFKDFAPLPSGHILPAACGESNMDWNAILNGIGENDMIALFEYEIPDDLEDGLERCAKFINSL
ncbi:MAG: sugar phosphate isomerase/epimerase [Clostridia bacterium]|nr:sugar phosphate isomerase/epimerase [Clostridia bacterium]